MYSKHYVSERIEREKLIQKIGIGIELDTIRVDRHHINGAELHTITSTGIIIIRNERTNKIVTKLIARPGQIKRYYDEVPEIMKRVIAIAKIHQEMGYNKWKRKRQKKLEQLAEWKFWKIHVLCRIFLFEQVFISTKERKEKKLIKISWRNGYKFYYTYFARGQLPKILSHSRTQRIFVRITYEN